jgi:gas vesicle protein
MKNKSTRKVVEKTLIIGAGLATATIAATLLFGKNGKKNRKGLKDWSLKMKEEIIEKVQELKVVGAPVYAEIVDRVAKKYSTIKEIGQEELKQEIAMLKKEWHNAVKNSQKKTVSKKTRTV